MLVDSSNDNSYKVTLHNPFSGKLIHFPPLEKSIFLEHSGLVYRTIFPRKPRRGVLSIDPDMNRGEFVLMMTSGSSVVSLAFIKSGEELRDLKDIVYSNGLFYVLDAWGVLFSCDVSNDFKVRRITSSDIHYASSCLIFGGIS